MNENTTEKIDFAVGGQAVIEGVMMRSPGYVTVAVRKENGEITVKDDPYKPLAMRFKLFGIPFLRGVIGLFEMMIVGMKALNFSASVAIDEEEPENRSKKQQFFEKIMFAGSFIFALAMSLFLFKFLPLWITEWLRSLFPALEASFYYNLVDGVLKTSFFIIYIGILTLMPSLRRVFEYHGAEHKSIFAYEKGLELTADNAEKQSRFHPRCGTSFILLVFMISILMYTMLPRDPNFMNNFANRLMLLPIVAGISYEFLKWSAKHHEKRWMQWAITPGLWLQRLTTREPNKKQLEVACTALQKALELEDQKTAFVKAHTEPAGIP